MNQFKKTAIVIIGWIFIGLGILGLFLPILQGIFFIMIGLAILSSRSEKVRFFLKHLEERYPITMNGWSIGKRRSEVGSNRVEGRRISPQLEQ